MIQIAYDPSYFELHPYLHDLDPKRFAVSALSDFSEDGDVVFVYAKAEVRQVLELFPDAIKVGFQCDKFLTEGEDTEEMHRVIEQFDALWCITEGFEIAVRSHGKPVFEFPMLWGSSGLSRIGEIQGGFDISRAGGVFVDALPYEQGHRAGMTLSIVEMLGVPFMVRTARGTDREEWLLRRLAASKASTVITATELFTGEEVDEVVPQARALFHFSTSDNRLARFIETAVAYGVPSIASALKLQKQYYPGLVCRSIDDAIRLLQVDYESFEYHVVEAQRRYLLYGSPEHRQAYNDYVETFLNGLR